MAETVPHESLENNKDHEQRKLLKQRSQSSTRLNDFQKTIWSNPRTVGHTGTYLGIGKRLRSNPLKG